MGAQVPSASFPAPTICLALRLTRASRHRWKNTWKTNFDELLFVSTSRSWQRQEYPCLSYELHRGKAPIKTKGFFLQLKFTLLETAILVLWSVDFSDPKLLLKEVKWYTSAFANPDIVVAKFGSLPPVSSRNSLSLTDPPNHPLQAGYKFKIGTFPKTELKNRIQRISDKNVFRKHFVFHDIVAAARESNWTEMRHLTQLQSFPFFLFSVSLCLDFFLFVLLKTLWIVAVVDVLLSG